MQKIPSIPTARYWLLFLAVFSAHNLEEIWRDLPAWSAVSSPLRGITGISGYEKTRSLFVLAAVGLMLGATLVAYVLERKHSSRSIQWLVVFCVLMLANALYHVVLSLWTQTVMPGVVTAIMLVIPVYTWILYEIHRLACSNKKVRKGRNYEV